MQGDYHPCRADLSEQDALTWDLYERGLRSLLWRRRTPGLQAAVDAQLSEACGTTGTQLEQTLSGVYSSTRQQVLVALQRSLAGPKEQDSSRRARQQHKLLEASLPESPIVGSPDFHCDASMGGVARWLRAAGYDAAWWPGIDDDELLRKTLDSSAIMLTSDGPLMNRSSVRWGMIPALLVSVQLKRRQQFERVVSALQLPIRATRCMACGGPLRPVDKEQVRERIPPRTYPWLDEYFECSRCSKLFWEGTHWQRIKSQLEAAAK